LESRFLNACGKTGPHAGVDAALSTPRHRRSDIGGATGIYAFWFAGCGHSIHLVDIVSRHIEQARETAQPVTLPIPAQKPL
jgi:2-polyprenyl-3-methyl-5-hydroxy-6-metoxy-1,4-benzoquinol methylase